jgi:hypothetical protein
VTDSLARAMHLAGASRSATANDDQNYMNDTHRGMRGRALKLQKIKNGNDMYFQWFPRFTFKSLFE